jgi:hypothetical protein
LYDQSYPVGNYAGAANDEGSAELVFADDGFLYATMGSRSWSPWLVRIDPETGYAVPTRRFTTGAGRFDVLGDDLYMAGINMVRRVNNYKVLYNLSGSGTFYPACDDAIDNDSDGFTDYPDDPGCTNANDIDEQDSSVNVFHYFPWPMFMPAIEQGQR